jgi:hypothetical protein
MDMDRLPKKTQIDRSGPPAFGCRVGRTAAESFSSAPLACALVHRNQYALRCSVSVAGYLSQFRSASIVVAERELDKQQQSVQLQSEGLLSLSSPPTSAPRADGIGYSLAIEVCRRRFIQESVRLLSSLFVQYFYLFIYLFIYVDIISFSLSRRINTANRQKSLLRFVRTKA